MARRRRREDGARERDAADSRARPMKSPARRRGVRDRPARRRSPPAAEATASPPPRRPRGEPRRLIRRRAPSPSRRRRPSAAGRRRHGPRGRRHLRAARPAPRTAVDVRGVTIAATGEVHCVPGIRNIRRLLAVLGRTDVPVACGRENPGPTAAGSRPSGAPARTRSTASSCRPWKEETARDGRPPSSSCGSLTTATSRSRW